jgi:hypothetical protein
MQRGTVEQRGKSWVVRFNIKVLDAHGTEKWISKACRLTEVGGAYRTAASVRKLADAEIVKHASATISRPTSTKTLKAFIEQDFLPHIKATRKPSTYASRAY